eukprot:tig00021135_g18945.t1
MGWREVQAALTPPDPDLEQARVSAAIAAAAKKKPKPLNPTSVAAGDSALQRQICRLLNGPGPLPGSREADSRPASRAATGFDGPPSPYGSRPPSQAASAGELAWFERPPSSPGSPSSAPGVPSFYGRPATAPPSPTGSRAWTPATTAAGCGCGASRRLLALADARADAAGVRRGAGLDEAAEALTGLLLDPRLKARVIFRWVATQIRLRIPGGPPTRPPPPPPPPAEPAAPGKAAPGAPGKAAGAAGAAKAGGPAGKAPAGKGKPGAPEPAPELEGPPPPEKPLSPTEAALKDFETEDPEVYADLYRELAWRAGLRVVKITGTTAGFSPLGIKQERLAWCLVDVDGAWRCVDTCWGAGRVDRQRKLFCPAYDDFWYCTPPELFALSHLPDDPDDQQLPFPVSRDTATSRVIQFPAAFAAGLEPAEPRLEKRLLKLSPEESELMLAFGAPAQGGRPAPRLRVELKRRRGPDGASGARLPKRAGYVLLSGPSQEGGRAQWRARIVFPHAGRYSVRVVEAPRPPEREARPLFKYHVEVGEGSAAGADPTFPQAFALASPDALRQLALEPVSHPSATIHLAPPGPPPVLAPPPPPNRKESLGEPPPASGALSAAPSAASLAPSAASPDKDKKGAPAPAGGPAARRPSSAAGAPRRPPPPPPPPAALLCRRRPAGSARPAVPPLAAAQPATLSLVVRSRGSEPLSLSVSLLDVLGVWGQRSPPAGAASARPGPSPAATARPGSAAATAPQAAGPAAIPEEGPIAYENTGDAGLAKARDVSAGMWTLSPPVPDPSGDGSELHALGVALPRRGVFVLSVLAARGAAGEPQRPPTGPGAGRRPASPPGAPAAHAPVPVLSYLVYVERGVEGAIPFFPQSAKGASPAWAVRSGVEPASNPVARFDWWGLPPAPAPGAPAPPFPPCPAPAIPLDFRTRRQDTQLALELIKDPPPGVPASAVYPLPEGYVRQPHAPARVVVRASAAAAGAGSALARLRRFPEPPFEVALPEAGRYTARLLAGPPGGPLQAALVYEIAVPHEAAEGAACGPGAFFPKELHPAAAGLRAIAPLRRAISVAAAPTAPGDKAAAAAAAKAAEAGVAVPFEVFAGESAGVAELHVTAGSMAQPLKPKRVEGGTVYAGTVTLTKAHAGPLQIVVRKAGEKEPFTPAFEYTVAV